MDSNPVPGARLRPAVITTMLCLTLVAAIFALQSANATRVSAQTAPCVQIADPREIPAPRIITFDDLANNTILNTQYQAGYGVTFPGGQGSVPTIHTVSPNDPDTPASPPNVARNVPIPGVPKTPLVVNFTFPRTYVGVFLGNGGMLPTGAPVVASVTAMDASGGPLCTFRITVPLPHTAFYGVYDSAGRIASISINYGAFNSESIDNLYLAPGANYNSRKQQPTWTPVPTLVPTEGPLPTATPVLPVFPLYAYKIPVSQIPVFFIPNFGVWNIEITQGVQCLNGQPAGCADDSLPLVLSKSTVVRIYVRAMDSHSYYSNVPVRLHLLAFGKEYIFNGTAKSTSSLNQNNHDAAEFYFTVYSGAISSVGVWAEIDPDHIYASSTFRYPAVGYNTYTFDNRRTLTVAGERLRYHPSGYSGSQYAGGWAVNGGAAQWWNQILPVSDNGINYFVRSGYLDWTTSLGTGDGQHSLIGALNLMWIKENALAWWFGTGPFTGVRHVYGWAPSQGYSGGHADMPIYPHAGGLGVVGIGSDAPGTDTDNPGSGALIFGHELTHDYDVYHTNTPDACGSNDSNSNFPYSNSSIQSFGFNTLTGKIYNPSLTHDLMSYCPSGGSKQGWISPFTWTTMYNKLFPALNAPLSGSKGSSLAQTFEPNTFVQTSFTQSLVVNAVIDNPGTNPTVTGHLGTLNRIVSGLAYTTPPGEYFIEEYDASGGGGTLLLRQSFNVDFTSEYVDPGGPFPPPPFPAGAAGSEDISFIMPLADGTRSIVLKHLQDVLDTRDVSQNSPQVKITSPVQDIEWQAHTTQLLSWTGSDLDGNPLTYTVMYSNDGGTSFILLADNLTATSYNVDVDSMAGSADVRFRVIASDGFNTGFDETPATITIPNHAPVAIITDPISNTIHIPGDLIVFHGIGTDMEDGTLPPASLVWSDNLQGGLGIGQSVPINNLTPGLHTITLTVTDSYNISTSTAVTINVAYPLYVPNVHK